MKRPYPHDERRQSRQNKRPRRPLKPPLPIEPAPREREHPAQKQREEKDGNKRNHQGDFNDFPLEKNAFFKEGLTWELDNGCVALG